MPENNFYAQLANKLGNGCNADRAKRCWEAWTASMAFNFPNDVYASAIAHRRAAFQDETGLPDGEVFRLCSLLAEFEKEQKAK